MVGNERPMILRPYLRLARFGEMTLQDIKEILKTLRTDGKCGSRGGRGQGVISYMGFYRE